MSHSQHPPIGKAGLAPSTVCSRCADIGEHPFENLDDTNMALLVARTREWMDDLEFPRSDSEHAAMRIMETTLVRMRHVDRIEREADELKERERLARKAEDGPTDEEIYNRFGVEGGIAYPMDDAPGSLGEHDWRL